MAQKTHKVAVRLSDALYAKLQAKAAENELSGLTLSDVVRQALTQVLESHETIDPPPYSAKVPIIPAHKSSDLDSGEKGKENALLSLQNW
jgi:hypothetical protein